MKTRYVITASCFDKKGRLISTGQNSYSRSHPLMKHFSTIAGQPYREKIHAELAALIRSKGKEVHTVLVQRFDANGNPKLAMPCKVCMLAIKAFGVKRIIYTTDSGKEELYI
jgi:deoxycytidylate deaminase